MKILFHGSGVPDTLPTRRDGDVWENHLPVKLGFSTVTHFLPLAADFWLAKSTQMPVIGQGGCPEICHGC
jgi:hypothetical protein